METEIPITESYQDFLFAINSPVTRERYSTRLHSFFVHIGVEGPTMDERCRRFVEKAKESEQNGNSKWAYASVIRVRLLLFIQPNSIFSGFGPSEEKDK